MGCDIHIVAEVKDENGVWQYSEAKIPDSRNYRTFGVLAGVRNGYGFAGCDIGDPTPVIAPPRGLPTDASPRTRKIYHMEDEDRWLGDHSWSWLTLRELLDYDWDRPTKMRGYVPDAVAKEFYKTGKRPEAWCDWTNQEDCQQIEWEEPIKERAWLAGKIIAALKPLGPPEKVRIVFGFDS